MMLSIILPNSPIKRAKCNRANFAQVFDQNIDRFLIKFADLGVAGVGLLGSHWLLGLGCFPRSGVLLIFAIGGVALKAAGSK